MDVISAVGAGQRVSDFGAVYGPSRLDLAAPLLLIKGHKSGTDVSESLSPLSVSSSDRFSDDWSDWGLEDELLARLERYAGQTEHTVIFAEWLRSQPGVEFAKYGSEVDVPVPFSEWLRRHPTWEGSQVLARRLAGCGSWLMFRDFFERTRDRYQLVGSNSCRNAWLCPACGGKRSGRCLAKAMRGVNGAMRADGSVVPYMLTLTIRGEDDCREMFCRLRGLVSRVLQQRRDALKGGGRRWSVWAEFSGGIVAFEVKRGAGSGQWHIHCHVLVLGRPGLEKRCFQEAWSELLGYWAQVDLQPFYCTEQLLMERDAPETQDALVKDLKEVFKYPLKFTEMQLADRWEAYLALRGGRLLCSFGSLYNPEYLSDEVHDDGGSEVERYRNLYFRMISDGVKLSYQRVTERSRY